MEIWKDIKGYEGLYQVSNHGRVKSLDRVILIKWIPSKLKGKLIKLQLNKGYLQLRLSKNGITENGIVHKLVAVAFIGHENCGYNQVVRHLDGNPLNNHVDNLAVGSQRQNIHDKQIVGTSKFRGVSRAKGMVKWWAHIKINSKSKHLGTFETEIDAHNAFQKALSELK